MFWFIGSLFSLVLIPRCLNSHDIRVEIWVKLWWSLCFSSCVVIIFIGDNMEAPWSLFFYCGKLERVVEISGESCIATNLFASCSYLCGCSLVLHDIDYTFYVMQLVDLWMNWSFLNFTLPMQWELLDVYVSHGQVYTWSLWFHFMGQIYFFDIWMWLGGYFQTYKLCPKHTLHIHYLDSPKQVKRLYYMVCLNYILLLHWPTRKIQTLYICLLFTL